VDFVDSVSFGQGFQSEVSIVTGLFDSCRFCFVFHGVMGNTCARLVGDASCTPVVVSSLPIQVIRYA
jgi:hypothetical protein